MPRDIKKITSKKERRGNNEGSIFQRKDGRWCGQVLKGYDEKGKPIRSYIYGKTRIEVAKKVADATNTVFLVGYSSKENNEDVLMQELIHQWLYEFKKDTVAGRTFEWYLNLTKSNILPVLGCTAVKDVTTFQLQKLLNDMGRKQGKAYKTIKSVRFILKQIMQHGVDMEVITENPAMRTKLPREERLTVEEQEKAIPIKIRQISLIPRLKTLF